MSGSLGLEPPADLRQHRASLRPRGGHQLPPLGTVTGRVSIRRAFVPCCIKASEPLGWLLPSLPHLTAWKTEAPGG